MYPALFNMSEDYVYRLDHVQTLDCAEDVVEIQPPNNDSIIELQDPCVDWEVTAVVYEEAFGKWKEPECYTFTYLDQSSYMVRKHVVQTVQNGTALPVNGDIYLAFQTLTDV